VWYAKKKSLPSSNIKLQKMEYRIRDEQFISKNCTYRRIFDVNIAVPQNWEIGIISKEDSDSGWSVSFIDKEKRGLDAFIIVKSKGFGKSLAPVSKVLGFDTLYDFEKRINSPTRSPIYAMLKTLILPPSLKAVDQAITPAWKGFIKISTSNGKNIYDASLYSIPEKTTCAVMVVCKEKRLSPQQAKSIIASVKFEAPVITIGDFFQEGKNALSRSDYTTATLDFINALYLDEKNAEYAYYLGRALSEDPGEAGIKPRLNSAKRFLDYALKLQPDHQKAKKLYRSVSIELTKSEFGY
jgi:tetratricopeptide (TPR) repeat protein